MLSFNATSDTAAFRVPSPEWFPFASDASAVSPVNVDTCQPIQLLSWPSAHAKKSLSNVSVSRCDTDIWEMEGNTPTEYRSGFCQLVAHQSPTLCCCRPPKKSVVPQWALLLRHETNHREQQEAGCILPPFKIFLFVSMRNTWSCPIMKSTSICWGKDILFPEVALILELLFQSFGCT